VTCKLRNHFIEKICSFDDEASLDEYPNDEASFDDEASLDEYPTHRENIFFMVINHSILILEIVCYSSKLLLHRRSNIFSLSLTLKGESRHFWPMLLNNLIPW